MQRIVQGRSATLQHAFHENGVATNPSPDAATIGITRDDGTVLVAAGTATTDTGTGVVSYTLTPTQTALLDSLTVTWTATFGGQPQAFKEIVEVAGDVLFTIAQARAVKPLDNATAYPLAAITEARVMVETALEDACGVAFVPRYKRLTVSGDGSGLLMLPPRTTAIRSVTRAGVAFTSLELADILLQPSGLAYYPSGWTAGNGNLVVGVEHGYPYPPPRVTQAALTLAKNWLVRGPIDDRSTSFSTEDGTFLLSTPGMRGATFGVPEVDATVSAYSLNVAVA